ncbi:uncharacterized protein An08g01280 [Aspergillus niger]|uniref:Contig An08c0030, genomic contig n=2 Tax=Aspergillus niger TaxID=5061 RepID=A2QQ50_ASPNC|nr:uncharacterized protein An08g01280 [Aspergillus niger]CAK39809.1 unnamed protein product [Aspergillus niger]
MEIVIAGKKFLIIGTSTKHIVNQECTGFILTVEDFGQGRDGLLNAIYVYVEELKQMAERFQAAICNLGNAHAHTDMTDLISPRYQITMDGKQAARLVREIKVDYLVPMHYDSWHHSTQFGKELRQVFQEEGINDQISFWKGTDDSAARDLKHVASAPVGSFQPSSSSSSSPTCP